MSAQASAETGVPGKEHAADEAASLADECKKQTVQPTQRRVFVVKAGSESVDEKCYMMAHVMCSMSSSTNGCGAVFWAAISEFRRGQRNVELPDKGPTVIYDCLITECPECGHLVGGMDVEFKMLSATWLRKQFGVDIEEPKSDYFAGQRPGVTAPVKQDV